MKTITAILAVIVILTAAGLLYGTQNPAAEPGSSIIRGKIIFTGTATRRAINMSGSQGCPQGPQYINEGFDDVMVYANPAAPSSHQVPSNAIFLDRRECRFVPHTITMQVGQQLRIRNTDGTAHNAHAWAAINSPFNDALAQGAETTRTFTQEEFRIPIRDDMHNWEVANIGVFAHPYHAVVKLNDSYEFKLRAGRYQINAWNESLGTRQQFVELKEGETRELDITFQ